MNLFTDASEQHMQPLAYRMRPQDLSEYIGQEHIIGEGRLLRRAIQADQLSSVIFYGPPGTGKTTLARVIANTTKSHFSTINAVLSGVKELRQEIEEAKNRREYYQKRTILFVDEVHRWNKSQQDALLPWVENGTFILIGATTENPYFEVNAALVSRSRIFQLTRLDEKDLYAIAQQALSCTDRGYGSYSITFEDGALEHLVSIAAGDARSLLNALELAVETTPERFPPEDPAQEIYITREAAEESIQQKAVLYDKEGDYHYDVISAFIKSIRGSDPDASLYWLARMVQAGEDPKYIFRRMLISACEDVGMADPQALGVVSAAAAAYDRVGLPEGRFHLTQAVLYLSTAAKSNSSLGFFTALKQMEQETDGEVPNHLKDGSRDKKGFGHGNGYLYPHAYTDHWVTQQYLPTAMQGSVFYQPSDQGYEKQIRTQVEQRREAQLEGALTEPYPEILTFSPANTQREKWLERLISDRGAVQDTVRTRIFSQLKLQRHSRVLVLEQGRGMLVWEACRHTPEGGVSVICRKESLTREIIGYAAQLPELDRPHIITAADDHLQQLFGDRDLFDAVIGQHAFTRVADKLQFARELYALCSEDARLSLCEIIPRAGQRLSELCRDPKHRRLLEAAELLIYRDTANCMVNFDEQSLIDVLRAAGFRHVSSSAQQLDEPRRITSKDIDTWLNASYRPVIEAADLQLLEQVREQLKKQYDGQIIDWRIIQCFITGDLQDS
ncbi:MAG: AAA family ATPase [Spirochaetia bacterium]|nr:AAA family ATPase [Spirochaetia bacterium]